MVSLVGGTLEIPPVALELPQQARMLFGRAVHLEEEVSDLAGLANGEPCIGRHSEESRARPWDRDLESALLALVPFQELDVWRLA